MEYVEKNNLAIFRSELLKDTRILHGFTTKKTPGANNLSIDAKNGKVDSQVIHEFSDKSGLANHRFVFQNQIHSDNVSILTESDLTGRIRFIPQNDGVITNVPGVCLCSFSADCLSILLAHPESGTIANAHSGRRGALLNLPVKLVLSMCREFLIPPSQLIAVLGTCISASCYEVGEDVVDEIKRDDPTALGYLIRRESKRFFDLRGYVFQQLTMTGINPENIDSQQQCSHCYSELFYSYRRDKTIPGRQIGFIATPFEL